MPYETNVLLLAILSCLAVAVIQNFKWLRVAQRSHYLPRETGRLERLWFARRPVGVLWVFLATTVALIAYQGPLWFGNSNLLWGAVLAPICILPTPWRFPLRGVTSRLAWTPRAVRLYLSTLLFQAALGVLGVYLIGPAGVLIPLLFSAHLTDLALGLLWYVERQLSMKFVRRAQRRLNRVSPRVVAITGSYGKTSSKGYVAQLISKSLGTVASPASFNNLMGLSKTINERLVSGTEVFVAEMGMNAEGRIRELTDFFPPDIAAITVVGEAHMERLGSKEAIFRAKSEITEKAPIVVLPIDQAELRALGDKCERQGKRVIRVSTQGKKADVVLDSDLGTVVYGYGSEPACFSMPSFGHSVNLAVALGVSLALGVARESVIRELEQLPVVAHRAEITSDERVTVIDDTYNSNPSGAARAVQSANQLALEKNTRLLVVTPGMVELGPVQFKRNLELAQLVIQAGAELIIVGRTNRKALTQGSAGKAKFFNSRREAVSYAMEACGSSGVILYENDLPDHYP